MKENAIRDKIKSMELFVKAKFGGIYIFQITLFLNKPLQSHKATQVKAQVKENVLGVRKTKL